MAEAVRLVVWDLDETFWKGTLTEGGIQEYLIEHHNIIVSLAERGILSSICSKNNFDDAKRVLEEHRIFSYFVFPSISWDSKGARLAKLVDDMQLRPESVMFIDDNPNNRAEAVAFVPAIQVENELFISRLLADERFQGKDDTTLSRLKQYKLLEARKSDADHNSSSNEEFLRSCDIRIYIEYDVISHIDRAIELINRTNQLNFTKRRLPEDVNDARNILKGELEVFTNQAGLVRVVDKYGDYGFVGFFLTQTMRHDTGGNDPAVANSHLRHFCFSCRTLGMLIEQWIYDHLRRPQLTVAGSVLTDLSSKKDINWIRLVESLDTAAAPVPIVAPKIIFWGGCEANAVGVYLSSYANEMEVYGSYAAGSLFIRSNSAVIIENLLSRNKESYAPEASILKLPQNLNSVDLFDGHPEGTLYILNCMLDAPSNIPIFKHKLHSWVFHAEPPYPTVLNFHLSEQEFERVMDETIKPTLDQRNHLLDVRRHVYDNYVNLRPLSDTDCVAAMRRIIEQIPSASKLVMALDHDEHSNDLNQVWRVPAVTHYCSLMRALADEYSYVGVATYTDVIRGKDEIRPGGGNHYSRLVYLRFAQKIIEVAADLLPKASYERQAVGRPDAEVGAV